MTGSACNGAADLESPSERTSGVDRNRAGAKEVSVGATIFDDIDVDKGDTTDWKYVTVPSRGVVTMKITFDNPKALGQMIVTDERGQVLSIYKDENRRVLDNITFKGETGRYYMQIFAEENASSYSLEVTFSSL